jgi:protein arginine N-methyltransferase 1
MLEDHKRTGAYYNAVLQNRRQFHGKVVLDVGTGSGILALFAAKAGAKKVYAVEATDMAKHARSLVEHNKVGGGPGRAGLAGGGWGETAVAETRAGG